MFINLVFSSWNCSSSLKTSQSNQQVRLTLTCFCDRYREAGAEVIEVLSNFCNCVERASIDEAYLDLTEEAKKLLTSQTSGSLTADQLSNILLRVLEMMLRRIWIEPSWMVRFSWTSVHLWQDPLMIGSPTFLYNLLSNISKKLFEGKNYFKFNKYSVVRDMEMTMMTFIRFQGQQRFGGALLRCS